MNKATNVLDGLVIEIEQERPPLRVTLEMSHELAKMWRLELESLTDGAPDIAVNRLMRELVRQLGQHT